MIDSIKRMLFKYSLLKRDLIESEKFHEAKIVKDFMNDLNKLIELKGKNNGR